MSTDNSELVDSETMALLNLIEQDMDGKWAEAMQTAITALQQSKPVQQEAEQLPWEKDKPVKGGLKTGESEEKQKHDKAMATQKAIEWARKEMAECTREGYMDAAFNFKALVDAAQQPSIGNALREKLEGMRFDLSLLAASDDCFNELEAKCEAFDEAISIADSMSGVTPIEGEDNE